MGVTRMEGSKITSKTSSLKALLLKAWRERWTDLQWGIHIKTILPRGVSGDVYNLADCILQQALVGSGPNHLVLSYLKHSLSSQLVSYAAVLQRIAKFDGFHKPHCVTCLLEFVESIQSGITCRGKPEEGILASSVLSLAHWLLQCYQHAAATDPSSSMLSKPPVILQHMLSCNFLTAMLTLAKYDDPDLYDEVVKKCHEIISLHQQETSLSTPVPIRDSLVKLCRLGSCEPRSEGEPLTYILQPILAVCVMLNPCIDTNQLANQIRLINKLKGYSGSRLACEVMRAALMNLYNAFDSEASKWGAFTFLNLPNILANLFPPNSEGNRGNEIVEGLDELLGYGPLIELVDSAQSGKSLEALLNELNKIKLINDQQLKSYISRREGAVSVRVDKLPPQTPLPIVIIRAQATLQRVLMTLDADNSKIQEAIIGVLCQVLTGKSFELILAVASVEGKLQTFVSKLIRFNEFSKAGPTARPVLFDITFIMLTYIVQVYGSKDVFSKGREESFFEFWSTKCLVERGSPKCPDAILDASDPVIVDTLLTMLNSNQPPDLMSCGISCDALCQSMPGVMKEVLVAWEHGALSATDVKRILDNLKHGLCCLAICAAAWLCTHMQMLEQDALLKPMNMVQQLLCVGAGGGAGSGGGEDTSPSGPAPTTPPPPPDSFRERSILMSQVIRKIQYDVHLIAPHTKLKTISQSHGIMTKEPLSEELGKVWEVTLERGMLSIQSTRQLENLFYTAGAEWLVTNLVAELMKVRYRTELEKGVDLVTAIFHIDIETCTQVLLNKLIPSYLHLNSLRCDLMEPQSECLARLSVYCLYSAMEQHNVSSSRKRPAPPILSQDVEDMVLVGSKLSRLDESGTSRPGGSAEPGQVSIWLGKLLKLFNSLVENANHLSQSTNFVFTFLKLLSLDNRTQPDILHLIPPTLVRGLVRLVPDQFSEQLVLSLYDLTSLPGRRSAASDLCLLRNIELKPPL